jgi:hypothetical protein
MDGDTVASPAEAWSPNELQSIARTDDFHISPLREDGKPYGTPTWIGRSRFGRIDVLVNNAASFYAGYFEELTLSTSLAFDDH